jgi:hypothetical protein
MLRRAITQGNDVCDCLQNDAVSILCLGRFCCRGRLKINFNGSEGIHD